MTTTNRQRGGAESGAEVLLAKLLAIPPVTRFLLLVTVALSLGSRFAILSPNSLYFSTRLTFRHFQLHRFVTDSLFVPINGFFYLFTISWIYQTSRQLEEAIAFTPDYLYCILIILGSCNLISHFTGHYFNFLIFYYALTFVFGQYMGGTMHHFFGFFKIDASLLCYVYALFDIIIIGQDPLKIFLGVMIGAMYYTLKIAYPRKGGPSLLKTPPILISLVTGQAQRGSLLHTMKRTFGGGFKIE